MRAIKIAATSLFVALCSTLTGAQAKPASTRQENRERIIHLIRVIEAHPLGEEAKKARGWLISWRPESSGITVRICGDIVEPLLRPRPGKKHSLLILLQVGLSSAAFMLEHPERAKDYEATNLAGLEGALKVYESIVKTEPDERWEFLDALVEKREKGLLDDYVHQALRKGCRKKRTLIPVIT
jgi:carboxypeptidase Q